MPPPVALASPGDLARIDRALAAAAERIGELDLARLDVRAKADGDPVTVVDRAVNDVLRDSLPLPGEGWLSEETVDDPARLAARRVWIVDPIDGTRELIAGIPEWCVSVGLVDHGEAIAGGILNPSTGEVFTGGPGVGLWRNGQRIPARRMPPPESATVLASRSETGRGEWRRFEHAPFKIRVVGSAAYKLALVAAGVADATWTLVPKSEWDVAGGVALLLASGVEVVDRFGGPIRFNQPTPRVTGLIAIPEWRATAAWGAWLETLTGRA
ncbi:MAG: 3'(2'),5'-bisphosphate nucleotidase CysQ [Planctomycetota bacterium]